MPHSPVKPIPDGFHAVTPHLVCQGAAAALDFYARAFGAEELSRLPGPDGRLMHASMRIADSVLMLNDEFPEMGCVGPQALTASPVVLHLYVRDVDAAIARAEAAGAKVTMPATDMFWGDRYGQVRDPFGHQWSLATHLRDVTPEQMREAMAAMGPGDPCAT
ncbi:MAG: VOC family protein [Burkholderiaceae bacterium]|nr:VOC family protein [Burkholderiaceae bacterium]